MKKRYIIAIIISILFPFFSAEAISFVQSKTTSPGYINHGTMTPVSATTAGDTLIVSMFGGGNPNTPTDTAGNVYTKIGTAASGFSNVNLYYATNTLSIASATCSTSNTSYLMCTLYEIAGVNNASPIDASSSFSTSTKYTFATSSPLTTTNANDLIIYTVGGGSNILSAVATATAPFVLPTSSVGGTGGYAFATSYDIFSTTQTNLTAITQFSTSTVYGGLIVAFKSGAAPPPTPTGTLEMAIVGAIKIIGKLFLP